MNTQGTSVPIERNRTVVVRHRYRTKKGNKKEGWHIRLAIAYCHKGRRDTSYHATMTESEARSVAKLLIEYADEMSKNSN